MRLCTMPMRTRNCTKRAQKLIMIRRSSRYFKPNDYVILYNSHLQLFFRNLRFSLVGSFTLKKVRPYFDVVILSSRGEVIIVNIQRVKQYWAKAKIPESHIVQLDELPTNWTSVPIKLMTLNKRLVRDNPLLSMCIIEIFVWRTSF